jgi:hypothetical protein
MEKVLSNGQMEISILDRGKMVNNTELVSG